MGTYRELRVWQQAVDLALHVYRVTEQFPHAEQFGLTSQLRRAAVSISSNIAEGKGRHTDRDFCGFLFRARGSLLELETQILIASRLGYLGTETQNQILEESAVLGRGLNALINAFQPAEPQRTR
ncbi:MAG TPA: four helix bundle protein [Clostridia bacterium]|nr:four helix bundle protein [Clostridia bacterium]